MASKQSVAAETFSSFGKGSGFSRSIYSLRGVGGDLVGSHGFQEEWRGIRCH